MLNRIPSSRVHLPRRSVVSVIKGLEHDEGAYANLVEALADRIRSLPGVECHVASYGKARGSRRYYLQNEYALDPTGDQLILFATLDAEARITLNSSRTAIDEAMRTGWGDLNAGCLRTFPPRDHGDVTIIWRIVLMAYFDIAERRDFRAWRDTRHKSIHAIPVEDGSSVVTPGAFF